jgi:hypothetical protein
LIDEGAVGAPPTAARGPRALSGFLGDAPKVIIFMACRCSANFDNSRLGNKRNLVNFEIRLDSPQGPALTEFHS